MKDNRKVLNEAFFKKATYEEKRAKRLPQYTPVGKEELPNAFNVTDTEEVKKRLAGTFGVAFGNNSVRSMASRALKTFPILVSDHVEPETVVTLKKLMEEQYAEYINLLVSNQVVDLASFTAGEEGGNIAIQALDTLSGTNFSKSRLADKALSQGKVTTDDVFANMPLYSLLRESNLQLNVGDTVIDSLLEGAVIVNSDEEARTLAKFMLENADEITELNEATSIVSSNYSSIMADRSKGSSFNNKKDTLDSYLKRLYDANNEESEESILKNARTLEARRGMIGVDDNGHEVLNRITTADIVIDSDQMDKAINRSIGAILTDENNLRVRDKFEKATFLLQSRRISGFEYYNYVTIRLGLPVSDNARKQLHAKFKIGDLVRNDKYDFKKEMFFNMDKNDVKRIAQNRRLVAPIVSDICGHTLKNTLVGTLGGAGLTAGTLGIASAAAGPIAPALWLLVLAGAGIGGLGGALISKLRAKSEKKKLQRKMGKIEGWERVEALIEAMEKTQADINHVETEEEGNDSLSPREIKDQLENYSKFMDDILSSSKPLRESTYKPTFYSFYETLSTSESLKEDYETSVDELFEDPEFTASLTEARLLAKTSTPVDIKYIEKKPGKDVLVTPSFLSRTSMAYGSTEIERRDNKERKYNQPLIMTIKFKERFSDGKFSDNELTAVIGILGKVIRIPSDEMEYILKANIEGDTVTGIFKNSGGDLSNVVGELLSTSKLSKEIKNLPQSADVWKNLEKVATLAAANHLAGKKSSNIANAHIVFSQKEIDNVRTDMGVDYLRDTKKAAALMKRYSAFTLMVANDIGQRVAILDDRDAISWEMVPYSAVMGKDSGDQLTAALSKLGRL